MQQTLGVQDPGINGRRTEKGSILLRHSNLALILLGHRLSLLAFLQSYKVVFLFFFCITMGFLRYDTLLRNNPVLEVEADNDDEEL
jgi:hypothetical protein